MKRVKKKVFITNIRLRLTIYYSLLIIAVSLVLVCVISKTLLVEFRERKNELYLQEMDVINQDIDNKMKGFSDNIRAMKNSKLIDEFMKGTADSAALYNYMQDSRFYIKGVKSFILLNKDKEMVFSFASDYRQYAGDTIMDMINKSKDNYYTLPHNYPFGEIENDYMDNKTITYCRAIRDNENYRLEGYLMCNITRDYLCGGELSYSKELFDETYIVNADGEFIYRTGARNEDVEKHIENILKNTTPQGGWYVNENSSYFVKRLQVNPDWIVVGGISNGSLMRDINRIRYYILFTCCLGILLVILISHQIAKRITSPIFALKNGMSRLVEGDMPSKVDVVAYDELKYLVQGYNIMVEDLNVYVDAMYQYGRKISEAEIQSLKFQLESLQSQINPHFLYNTLNTVSYLAMQKRTMDVRKMIQSLNQLLRCTLSDTSELITIEEEIQFLHAYVGIQEYRYPDMITLKIRCEPDVKEMLIPKLILQPLVENAILHGIFPTGKKGNIDIQIFSKSNRIFFVVEDNGIGMKTEDVEKIKEKKGFNRIGVTNVQERLQLYYGETSELMIVSEYGKGTVIKFDIPEESRG